MLAAVDRTLTDWVFRLVLLTYVAFSFLDWLTTASALTQGGREGNPIAASLYSEYGSAGLLLFKAIVIVVIIGVLALIPRRLMSKRVAMWVGTAFVAVTAFAVIGNLHALASLSRGPWDYHPAAHAFWL